MLKAMKSTLARDHNWKGMRDVLRNTLPPVIPYLGVFLTGSLTSYLPFVDNFARFNTYRCWKH